MPGKRKRARVVRDFYETPPWSTDLIIDHLPSGGVVCDPACGNGAILERFQRARHRVIGSDIDGRRVRRARERLGGRRPLEGFEKRDATTAIWLRADLYATNPPFTVAAGILLAGLATLDHYGNRATIAMLVRLSFEEPCVERATGVDRGELLRSRPYDRYILPERPRFRVDTKGTDSTTCAWLVWGPGRSGRTHFLPPRETT